MATKHFITCPGCGAAVGVRPGQFGRFLSCGKCGMRLRTRPADGSRSGEGSGSGSLIGRTLGRYRLLAQLGRGARGVVYEAEDIAIGRRLALKVMAPEVSAPEACARFLLEARAAGRLEHPNVISVYAVENHGGTLLIAMPLVRGGSLQDRLVAHGLPGAREATRQVRLAARGLAAVHAAGIVHRDIKPANIMAGDNGEVKIADFGMAKLTDDVVSGLTQAGTVVGTPHYMSPEQCLGEPVDGRADIYSLGATYFRLLTGSAPFADGNPLAVARMQVCEPHPDPRTIEPSVPAMCVRIIDRAMAKDRRERFQTAAEMADALEAVEHCLRQSDEMRAAADAGRTAADGPGLGETDVMDALRSSGELSVCSPPADASLSASVPPGVPSASDKRVPSTLTDRQPKPPSVRCGSGARRPAAAMDEIVLFSDSDLLDASAAEAAPRKPSSSVAPGLPRAAAGKAAESDFAALNRPARVTGRPMSLPVEVSFKFRFGSLDAARKGLNLLRTDVRGVLRNKSVAPTLDRGVPRAVLRFAAVLPPPELLGIAKSVICAGGEFLGLIVRGDDIGNWLHEQISRLKTASAR